MHLYTTLTLFHHVHICIATSIIQTLFIRTLDYPDQLEPGDQKIHYHACAEGVANDHLWVWSQVE